MLTNEYIDYGARHNEVAQTENKTILYLALGPSVMHNKK